MPAMVQDDSKHQLIQPNALHQYHVIGGDLRCLVHAGFPMEFASQGLIWPSRRRAGPNAPTAVRVHPGAKLVLW